MRRISPACLLWPVLVSSCAAAQAAEPGSAAPLQAAVSPAPSPAVVIPAGTLIALRIDQQLSSQTAKRGDTFPITLMNDLWWQDRVVLPAGTKGIGEVIHAAGKGFGGRAGELIVTARYLDHEGRRIRLSHFKLGMAGTDNAAAAVFASAAVPVAGLFVTGTSAAIGLGQLGQARLAEDVPVAEGPIAPPAATAIEIEKKGEAK